MVIKIDFRPEGVNVHGTKWAKNANIWPKMTKNAYFGPNLAVLGPKILILSGGSKSFGTHVTEKPHTHLARIVYWSGMGPNGPKSQYLAKNASFWPNLAVFWPISSHACWHLRHIRHQNTKTSLYKLSKNGWVCAFF